MKRFEDNKILDIRYLIFLVILVFVFSSLVFIPVVKAISPVGEGTLECEKLFGSSCWEECQKQDAQCAYGEIAPCMEENEDDPGRCSYVVDECARQSKDCQDRCNSDYDECLEYWDNFSSPNGSQTPSNYATCNNECSVKGLSEGTPAFEGCLNECINLALPQYTAPSKPPPTLKSAGKRFSTLGGQAGLGGAKSFEETAGGVIKGALALVGVIFFALMIYGGYIWMLARGDEQEAARAQKIITAAVIGIAVVMAAYAITYFIVYRLTVGTGIGLQ